MNEPSDLVLECHIHDLLHGDLSADDRCHVLSLIAHDKSARHLLDEMLSTEQLTRSAYGYDRAEPWIQAGLDRILAVRHANADHSTSSDQRIPKYKHLFSVSTGWLWPVAAVIAMTISVTMVIVVLHSNSRLHDQVAQITRSQTMPTLVISDDRFQRYRTVWQQVAHDGDTWLLLSNDHGEFGSIDRPGSPGETSDQVVAVYYQILNAAGRTVYSAGLLVPDRPIAQVKLPALASIEDRPVTLTISTSNQRATLGVWMDDDNARSVGVSGQIPIDGTASELGRVQLDNQTLRICVRSERLSGLGS